MLLETRKTAIFIRKESEKNRRIMSSHNTNTYNNLLCLSTTTTLTTTKAVAKLEGRDFAKMMNAKLNPFSLESWI